jgi:hypothetical protein
MENISNIVFQKKQSMVWWNNLNQHDTYISNYLINRKLNDLTITEYEIYYIYCMVHKICQWCGNKKIVINFQLNLILFKSFL